MGDFPLMTDKGTFIINGTERVVVSQLVRSPGRLLRAHRSTRPPTRTSSPPRSSRRRGAWLEFEIDKKDIVGVRVDRKRKQPVTVLLKALGWPTTRDPRAASATYESMRRHAREGPHRRPGRGAPRHLPQAAPGRAADARGRRRPCSRTSTSTPSATTWPRSAATRSTRSSALDAAARRRARSRSTTSSRRSSTSCACTPARPRSTAPEGATVRVETDDIDHFGNRRLRTVGELIQNQIRTGCPGWSASSASA